MNGFNQDGIRGFLVGGKQVICAPKKYSCTPAYGWRQVEQMFRHDNRLSWWLSNHSSNASE